MAEIKDKLRETEDICNPIIAKLYQDAEGEDDENDEAASAASAASATSAASDEVCSSLDMIIRCLKTPKKK